MPIYDVLSEVNGDIRYDFCVSEIDDSLVWIYRFDNGYAVRICLRVEDMVVEEIEAGLYFNPEIMIAGAFEVLLLRYYKLNNRRIKYSKILDLTEYERRELSMFGGYGAFGKDGRYGFCNISPFMLGELLNRVKNLDCGMRDNGII